MSHFGFPEQHREDAAPSRHWPGPDSAPAGSCPIESPLLSSSTSSFDQPPGDQAPRLMLLLDQFDHDTSLSLSLMQRRAEHLKRDLELTFQSKLRALARFRDITLAELLEAQGDPARALQRRVSRRMRQMAEQARAELPQPAERPDALAASDPAPPMGSPSLAGPGTTSPSPPGHASRRQVDMSNPSAPAQSNRRATMTFSPATIRQSWRASVARASTASLDEMSAVRCRKTTLPAGGAPAARRLPSALEEDSSFQPEILTLSSRRLREASLTPLDTPAPLLRSRSSLAPAVGQSPPLRPVALPSRAGLYNRHSSRPSLSLARPTMSPRRTSLSAGGRPPTRHTMAPSHGMAAQKASLSIGSRSTAALPPVPSLGRRSTSLPHNHPSLLENDINRMNTAQRRGSVAPAGPAPPLLKAHHRSHSDPKAPPPGGGASLAASLAGVTAAAAAAVAAAAATPPDGHPAPGSDAQLMSEALQLQRQVESLLARIAGGNAAASSH